MIKIALTAAAALALTSGAAFAQSTLGPQATSNNATTAVQPVAPPTTGSTTTMISNAPAGDAPTTYPMCSRRGQDRCMQHRPHR